MYYIVFWLENRGSHFHCDKEGYPKCFLSFPDCILEMKSCGIKNFDVMHLCNIENDSL